MSSTSVEAIANAVLYEGYILYPYRPATKNRLRWTFGGLHPRAYSEAQGGFDAWTMQTECLVRGTPQSRISVKVRFLHLIARTAGELLHPASQRPDDQEPEFRAVETLHVDERQYPSWQEATEREVLVEDVALRDLLTCVARRSFAFPGSRTVEPIRSDTGEAVGVLVREQQPITGVVELTSQAVTGSAYKLIVRVVNETALEDAGRKTREDALMHSLVSTHAVLTVRDGEFVSLMDPPDEFRDAAAECQNLGSYPVLVGEEGQKDTMLAAPIILYDYPQVAPESPGDLFDGTEIDEILTLRILTLTDEEKRQAAAVDPRAGRLLERSEALAREQLLSLHGTIRRVGSRGEEGRHA